MEDRRGEKLGWIGGWLGGFIWVLILSLVFVFQGKFADAAVGLVLLGGGVGAVVASAPWRHPNAPYWRLMVPVYAVLTASLVWLVWTYGGADGSGLNWGHLALAPLLLMPFWTAGRRRWNDPRTKGEE